MAEPLIDRGSDVAAMEAALHGMMAVSYRPHPILAGPHAMTVAGALLGRASRGVPEVERIFTVRPGVRVLAHESPRPPGSPTVVLAHGLEGSSRSRYMVGVAAGAWRAGFRVIRLNQRGCGASFPLTDSPYHAGLTEDLAAVLQELASSGHGRVYVAGFSLGGNQLLKLLGELGASAPGVLRGAVAVSVPVDLASAASALHLPCNRFYETVFVRALRRSYFRFHRRAPARFAPPARVRSLREFDDVVAGPANGFSGAREYYEKSSSGPFLTRIQVPTLLLQAMDDPMIPFASFGGLAMTEHVRLWATPRGGHVGFLGAAPERHWAEARIVELFARVEGLRGDHESGDRARVARKGDREM